MNRLNTLVFLALVGIAAGGRDGMAAQQPLKRPYDVLMKDVGVTFATLRKNLDGTDLAAITADAEKLERLFRETEDFWARFKTRDAIEAARGARESARTVATAAKEKDLAKARTTAAGLGRFCTACHNSHREQMPDKTYRIKP